MMNSQLDPEAQSHHSPDGVKPTSSQRDNPPNQSLNVDHNMPGNYTHLKRNEAFRYQRRPLKHHPAFRRDPDSVLGPISFLNPTRAHFHNVPQDATSYKWTSRNNRKGRHAVIVDPSQISPDSKHTVPRRTSSLRSIGRGVWRMLTVYPIWDVSYDVATIFTIGSVIWVINAFFVWLPLALPNSEFKNEVLYGGGITAFIGATVFEIGSILLMAEAVNEHRTGCFGWALERAFSHESEDGPNPVQLRPQKSACSHHHRNKRNLVGKGLVPEHKMSTALSSDSKSRSWTWFPSKEELRTHYLHELGFLASFAQLIGASIFWVSGLTALPGILNRMSRPIEIVFYWTPQVVGGLGFIISGTLFMVETQSRWYKPAFQTLGWWIGAWNLIGGVGFTICPAFGYDESSWAQYQACLSTFWGSWAFLIGSVIQWYESLEKYPVEVGKVPAPDDNE